jgi:hypothetical protein
MEQNRSSTGNEENLEMENQFLKLKMMLEHGAQFGSSTDLPAAIENDFLRSVMEFEKHFESGERIKVFDKLGRPTQFKPVCEIHDDEIDNEWVNLYEFMQERGIELSVCSPKIKARELYRFTIEELFECETDNINMPGMMTCFIYDEFHPDHEYENSRIAVEDCLHYFFDKSSYFDHHFAERVTVNQHQHLSKQELQYLVERFKQQYEEIVPGHMSIRNCEIKGRECSVTGCYEVGLMLHKKSVLKNGHWTVDFELNEELGYWDINNVQIRGLDFP